MTKYIIIDDEFLGVEVLCKLLTDNYPQAQFAGKAYNMENGLELIEHVKPDIVFLDIEMQGGDGFDLLTRLDRVDFKVVFVSSYDQYAIRAIKFNAFDYLLKPVIVSELLACLSRLEEVVPDKRTDNNSQSNPEISRLYFNHRTKLEYINFTDILYLKGDGNYTYIYTLSGKENYTSKTLKEYDEILCLPGSGFLRIHKSYIINTHFVESIVKKDNMYVVLKNGEKLEVSRRKKSIVLERLKMH